MTDVLIHENDSFAVLVVVEDKADPGNPKDITGATLSAVAVDVHGNTTAPDTLNATSPTQGEITVVFDKNKLTTGKYRLQVRVDLGSEAQIVINQKFTVAPAYT